MVFISCVIARYLCRVVDDIFRPQGLIVGFAPEYFLSSMYGHVRTVRIRFCVNMVRVRMATDGK